MSRKTEQGNVLFYILIAVALLGALSYVMTRNSGGQSSTSVQSTRIAEDLKAQAQLIRSAILECVLVNNYGYPATASINVKDLECQISGTPTHQSIFAGSASRVLPLPPTPFSNWLYTNNGSGTVAISIATPGASAGSKGVISALNQLKDAYAASEIAVVNNGVAASFTLYITKP